MNKCHFLGNLTRDPETRTTTSGNNVVNFGIAVNDRKSKDAEPLFLDCEAWDSGGELIAKHFKKGDPIIAHGELRRETWNDKNSGEKRSKNRLRVREFEFVPGGKKQKSEPVTDNEESYQDQDAELVGGSTDTEIPF